MATEPKTFVSPEEYLERERKAEFKSEYYGGEMFAMAGASRRHSVIVTNIVAEFRQQLKGRPRETYSTDLRLRVTPTGLYTYPDIIVVCGEPRFADGGIDTLINPKLIIEVLSDSTRDYDRGRKFQHYRSLSSLAEYVTVEQSEPHVEHWLRQPGNRWLLTEFADLSQCVQLASIDCTLALSEVYDKIDWAAAS